MPEVNGRFLVECLVFGSVVLFYLFASNRLLGRIASTALRTGTWLANKNVYIHIGAIQLSILGGRILFKDVRYKSRNQSVHIIKGAVTFRYWLWKARQGNDDVKSATRRHCRILVHLDGVQWYFYNRTPAYDSILDLLQHEGRAVNIRLGHPNGINIAKTSTRETKVSSKSNTAPDAVRRESWFERALPVEIEVHRGSVIAGNNYLPTIMSIDFHHGSGVYGTTAARSKHDLYKVELAMSFKRAKMHLRPNKDFRESLLDHAKHGVPAVGGVYFDEKGSQSSRWYNRFFNRKVQYEWHGLDRYRSQAEQDIGSTEYAKVENILDTPELLVTYYYDVPGPVPSTREPFHMSEDDGEIDIGNNDYPPEFGVELLCRGGKICYGPWADRQRGLLQNMFFPSDYKDSRPTDILQPGQERTYTALRINLMLEEGTALRVPCREASKDHLESSNTSSNRPYGWIEIKTGPKSSVFWNMAYVSDAKGWGSFVDVRIYDMEISTSVNSYILARASSTRIKCDLRNPLAWRQQRNWSFSFTVEQMKLCLLRDHVFLLTDLIKDFASGPPAPMAYFVPFTYTLMVSLLDLEVHLYVNDQNILPAKQDDPGVSVMIARCPRGRIDTLIPFTDFEQDSNTIPFDVELWQGVLSLDLANWTTHKQFLTQRTFDFGTIENYKLNGSYKYYREYSPDNVELATLDMVGTDVKFKLLGFVIRYFMVIRENYLATFVRHVTAENYSRLRRAQAIEERITSHRPVSDTFEVTVSALVRKGSIDMPTSLYDCDSSIVIDLDELQLDLRNLDSYLDLYVNFTALQIWSPLDTSTEDKPNALSIEDAVIHAHRLFGPSPRTLTYICNWEFHLGRISGQVMPNLLEGLGSFGSKFGYNFIDKDNAIAPEFLVPLDPDMTFLKATVKPIDICIWGKDSALQIALSEGLTLDYDDYMQQMWTSKVILSIPAITVRGLAVAQDVTNAFRTTNEFAWVEIAEMTTGIEIALYNTAANLKDRRDAQQKFVREEDAPSKRATFLYDEGVPAETAFHLGPLYSPSMQNPLHQGQYSSSAAQSKTSLVYKDIATNGVANGSSRRSKTLLFSPMNASTSSFSSSDNSSQDDSRQSGSGSVISKSLSDVYSTAFRTTSSGHGNLSDYSDDDGDPDDHADPESSGSEDESSLDPTVSLDALAEMSSSFHATPQSIPYGAYLRRYRLTTAGYAPSFAPLETNNPGTFSQPPLIEDSIHRRDSKDKETPSHTRYDFKSDDETVSTIYIKAKKSLDLMVSPIFLKTLKDFLEGFAADGKQNVEHILDELQLKFVSKQVAKSKILSTSRVRLSLPQITVHSIQDVAISEDFRTMFSDAEDIRSRLYDNDSILCVADFIFSDVDVQFASTSGRSTTLEVVLAKTQMNTRFITTSNAAGMFGIPDERQTFVNRSVRSTSASEPVVLDVSFDKLHLALQTGQASNSVLFHLDGIDFLAVDRSAEILIGAAFSWVVFGEELTSIVDKLTVSKKAAERVVLADLVKRGIDTKSKADGALYSKPSYLMPSTGRIVRNQEGWRFLCGLRHVYRSLDPESRLRIQTALGSIRDPALPTDLIFTFNGEKMSLRSNPILHDHFMQKVTPAAKENVFDQYLSKANGVDLRLGTISFRVYESDFENSIRVGPLEIDINSMLRFDDIDFLPSDPASKQGRPRTRRTLSERPEQGYVDCVARARCYGISIDLNPNLLALVKHLMRVQRLLEAKFEEMQLRKVQNLAPEQLVPASGSIRTSRTDVSLDARNLLGEHHVLVHGMLSLDSVSVTAEASNLALLLQFQDANASAIYYNWPSAMQYDLTLAKQSSTKGSQRTDDVTSLVLKQTAAVQIKHVSIIARDQGTDYAAGQDAQDLMTVEFSHLGFDAGHLRAEESLRTSTRDQVNMMITVGSFSVDIPQNLLKLYNFANRWRSENLASYDFLFKRLMNEFDETNASRQIGVPTQKARSLASRQRSSTDYNLHLLISSLQFSSKLLPSLTVEFEAWNWIANANAADFSTQTGTGEVVLSKQEMRFVTRTKSPPDIEASDNTQLSTFSIPTIRLKGKMTGPDPEKFASEGSRNVAYLDSIVTFDFAELTLNVGMIDNLFTAQSLLTSELNDLLELFLYRSRKRQRKRRASNANLVLGGKKKVSSTPAIAYLIRFVQRGFRIAVESPSAVMFFETDLLDGLITNASRNGGLRTPLMTAWKFALKDLSLSLNHNSGSPPQSFDERKFRLAYIVIDLTLQNFRPRQSRATLQMNEAEVLQSIYVDIEKIHTVMQPIVIGKLGDLYVYYTQELSRRKERKASELAMLTDNTKQILKSLDVDYKTYKTTGPSFLEEKSIYIGISRVGIAVPLQIGDDRAPQNTTGPALLVCTSSLGFLTKKWESSVAMIDGFNLQFVKDFDQINEEHFTAAYHTHGNKITLPQVKVELQLQSQSAEQRQLWVNAQIGGLEIEVDSNVVHFVNDLGDIYWASMERMEQFTLEASSGGAVQKVVDKAQESAGSDLHLEVEAAFVFNSSTIKLFPLNHDQRSKAADQLNLPGLSMWSRFKGNVGYGFTAETDERKQLHVEFVVHPSDNTLYPTVLPFIHDLLDGLKVGVQQKAQEEGKRMKNSSKRATTELANTSTSDSTDLIRGIDLSVYFRLSNTKFTITCEPTERVMLAFDWEEGNFLIASGLKSSKHHSITCGGRIRGASGKLRHSFSNEDCVRAEIKNIVFNATMMSEYSTLSGNQSSNGNAISLIVDLSQVNAWFDVRHLHYWFIMKAIWIDDGLDKLANAGIDGSTDEVEPVNGELIDQQIEQPRPFALFIAIRLQLLDLAADLGPAIGVSSFKMRNTFVEYQRIPGVNKGFRAGVDELELNAKGRLTGYAKIGGIFLGTQIQPLPEEVTEETVLHLLETSWDIASAVASLEYEYAKLLVFESDPLHLDIADTWSEMTEDKTRLELRVVGGMKSVDGILSVRTIPTFYALMGKLQMLIQEKEQFADGVLMLRTGKASRSASSGDGKTAFATVASKLQSISKDKSVNKESVKSAPSSPGPPNLLQGGVLDLIGFLDVRIQHLSLSLFGSHFYDAECLQVTLGNCSLELQRRPEEGSGNTVVRDLSMILGYADLLRSSVPKITNLDEHRFTLEDWFKHVGGNTGGKRSIFSVPKTIARMRSWQDEEIPVVRHVFSMDFDGQVGIAFYLGHIRYIQELFENYRLNMQKATNQNAAEVPQTPIGETLDMFGGVTENKEDKVQITTLDTFAPEPIPDRMVLGAMSPKKNKSKEMEEDGDKMTTVPSIPLQQEMEYIAIEPINVNPKIRLMGDATPPLEWIGVQRGRIPGLVHRLVTMNLDDGLEMMYGVYAKQLERAAKRFPTA